MRAAPFVVFEIVLEDPAQPGLMENNDVIQAFAPNGPDQALPVSVGVSRGLRRNVTGEERRFRVIHPHHPWCGHEFELIDHKQTWGEDRVFFHDEESSIWWMISV
jgi:hypothetical protein